MTTPQRPAGPAEILAKAEVPLTIGSCVLRNPAIATVVRGALRFFDDQRYHLHAWCIMPNHVHAVVTPLESFGLKQTLHTWKSFTANRANRLLGTSGAFWERESFDHLIRSPEHLEQFIQYTERNPAVAGLCSREVDWPWSSRSLRG